MFCALIFKNKNLVRRGIMPGSRHRDSGTQYRVARGIAHGEHWRARAASTSAHKYAVGDPVTVTMTGVETTVATIASWGDYELEGIKGYFSSRQLEPR